MKKGEYVCVGERQEEGESECVCERPFEIKRTTD